MFGDISKILSLMEEYRDEIEELKQTLQETNNQLCALTDELRKQNEVHNNG